MIRKKQVYVDRYGPDFGPRLYHAHQSQAAHAGVSARLRKKLDALKGHPDRLAKPRSRVAEVLPLFPEAEPLAGAVED